LPVILKSPYLVFVLVQAQRGNFVQMGKIFICQTLISDTLFIVHLLHRSQGTQIHQPQLLLPIQKSKLQKKSKIKNKIQNNNHLHQHSSSTNQFKLKTRKTKSKKIRTESNYQTNSSILKHKPNIIHHQPKKTQKRRTQTLTSFIICSSPSKLSSNRN
jgi:hypothetical protein